MKPKPKTKRVGRRRGKKSGKHLSVVYLITNGTHTKIGITTNLASRLSNLQTSNPQQLRVLLTLQGDEILEKRLHQAFAHKRTGGEWFLLDEKDIQQISALATTQIRQPEPSPEGPPEPQQSQDALLDMDGVRMLSKEFPAPPLDVFYDHIFAKTNPWMFYSNDKLFKVLNPDGSITWQFLRPDIERGLYDLGTSEQEVTKGAMRKVLRALARARNTQEQYEVLLQAAIWDASETARKPDLQLARMAERLAEELGLRIIARDTELCDQRPCVLGNLYTYGGKHLPFVEIWRVQVDSGIGYASTQVLVEAVLQSFKAISKRTFLFHEPELDLSEYPYTLTEWPPAPPRALP